MKRILLILLGLAALLLVLVFLFNVKEKTGMKQVSPDLTVEAATLYADFQSDEAAANETYLNKVVRVEGTVTGVEPGKNVKVRLAGEGNRGGVVCSLDPQSEHRRQEFHAGEAVSLKCIVTDYHREVVLKNCVEL